MTSRAVTPNASEVYARDLTERIRHSAEGLYELLLEAWESEAFKHLGYRTWTAYIEAEFDFTQRHAYRLVQQGQVIRAIKAGVAEARPSGHISDPVHITEAQARDIAAVLPQVTERVREQVSHGVAPQRAVEIAVTEVRRTPPAMPEPFEERQEPEHVHLFVCSICGQLQ